VLTGQDSVTVKNIIVVTVKGKAQKSDLSFHLKKGNVTKKKLGIQNFQG